MKRKWCPSCRREWFVNDHEITCWYCGHRLEEVVDEVSAVWGKAEERRLVSEVP